VRLEGSLDAFSLPDIFSLLSMTKKTGGLHLRRADAHGVVWLGDGLITGGASDLSRLSLGRRLAGCGHVAENHLTAAVEEVARSGELSVARVLRDHNSIDEGELHTLVYEHIVDTVFDLMRWPDGVFEFVVDEQNSDDVGVTRDVDEVVAEARRRLDLWAAIDDRVATPATVLSLALDLAVESQLQKDEWELLALIDGRRTVGDIVNLFGRGEYAVVVALAELVGRGLVRTDNTEGVAGMLRRQELIASLETGTPMAAPAIEENPVVEVTPVVEQAPVVAIPAPVVEATEPAVIDTIDVEMAAVPDPVTEPVVDDEPEGQVAEVADISRHSAARDLSAVTPHRPEPFLPGREPEHPEPLAAAMAGGGAVAASMPVGAIERDPSVNKSLLLRLIAGVRGL
jgi:hypothetical protein